MTRQQNKTARVRVERQTQRKLKYSHDVNTYQTSVTPSPSPDCDHSYSTADSHVYIHSGIPRRSASQQSQENLTRGIKGERHTHTSPVSDLHIFPL